MSTIKITYREQDEEQVRKVFEILMLWEGDENVVIQKMNGNPIAAQKKNIWKNELRSKGNIQVNGFKRNGPPNNGNQLNEKKQK